MKDFKYTVKLSDLHWNTITRDLEPLKEEIRLRGLYNLAVKCRSDRHVQVGHAICEAAKQVGIEEIEVEFIDVKITTEDLTAEFGLGEMVKMSEIIGSRNGGCSTQLYNLVRLRGQHEPLILRGRACESDKLFTVMTMLDMESAFCQQWQPPDIRKLKCRTCGDYRPIPDSVQERHHKKASAKIANGETSLIIVHNGEVIYGQKMLEALKYAEYREACYVEL